MTRIKILFFITLFAIVAGSVLKYWWPGSLRLRAGNTNVLVLIVDTLRADHLGCYGYSKPTSANIDALAAEGVVFEQTVANCSWTRPSIASLLTGVHPRTAGVYKEKFDALSPDVVTLAEMFQKRGYATLGVTANPSINSDFGFDRGFDHYGDCGFVWDWMKTEKADVADTNTPPDLEGAASVTDRTMAMLERFATSPFYMQALYIDPHTPYQTPQTFIHPLNQDLDGPIAHYDAEIAYVDQQIGRLLTFVREHHPNTLVVLLSDHGEGLLDHLGLPLSSTHGYHLYDSVLMVPLIFHHPDLSAGGRYGGQVQLLDLVPTLAELFDLQLDDQVAGTSLAPFLKGNEMPILPKQVFSETDFKSVGKISVREQNRKLVINKGYPEYLNAPPNYRKHSRIRIAVEASGPAELYNLPGEENPTVAGLNSIEGDLEAVKRLERSIADWEVRTPARPPVNRNDGVGSVAVRQLKALGYLDGIGERKSDEGDETTAR